MLGALIQAGVGEVLQVGPIAYGTLITSRDGVLSAAVRESRAVG